MSGKLVSYAKKARRRNACGLFNTHSNSQIHMEIPIGSSATMTDRAGLKLSGLFVTVVYSSATVADRVVLKQKQDGLAPMCCSATMADQVVLKPVGVDTQS